MVRSLSVMTLAIASVQRDCDFAWGRSMKCTKATWAAVVSAAMLSVAPAGAQSDVSATGTGFLINADGWIVTNAHVVDGCSRVSVAHRGSVAEVRLDAQNDIAVVRSPGAVGSALSLRTSSPRLGEDVAAFGFPLATVLSSSVKVTTGNVNSLLGMNDDTRYLQISTPIQPGNSGGPLVDRSGSVLGITTGVLTKGSNDVDPQNVNFAIRSGVLAAFLDAHAISFHSEAGLGMPLETADLADKVAPGVVQILCHGKPADDLANSPPAYNPPAVPLAPTRTFSSLDDHDVMGFDYATMRDVSMAQCQSACAADQSCKAATYNKRERFCFLKSDAALLVMNKDAFATVVDTLSSKVIVTTFAVATGRDMQGGDYRHFKGNFVACYVACETDPQCRAFAYVRKQQTCWLKNMIGPFSAKAGIDLGVK